MNRAAYDEWFTDHSSEIVRLGREGSAWELWQAATAVERSRCLHIARAYRAKGAVAPVLIESAIQTEEAA